MALPLYPANGQTAVANGITYIYNSTKGAWIRVAGTVTGTSVLAITSSTQSNSTTTGALTVVGGVGVGGNIYFGGNLYQNGVLFTGGGGASSTGTTSTFIISSTASTTSTNSGALQVVGGVGIGGSLFVGGVITATNFFAGTLKIDAGSTMTNLVVTSSATSTSTTTGAVTVTGGVGVGGNLNVGGNIVGGGVRNSSTSTAPNNPTIGDIWYNPTTDVIARYTSDGANSYWLDVAGPTVSGLTVQNTSVYANSFSGSQYLNLSAPTQLALGSGSWTIEFWINLPSFAQSGGANNQIIMDFRPVSTNGFYPALGLTTAGLLYFFTNNVTVLTSSIALVLNTWAHTALVKNGSTTTLYINGVSAGTYSDTNTYLVGASAPTIGVNGFTRTIGYLTGSISNLRVVGSAVYTATFTVPTAPLTAITNTLLLTCQTVPIVDASTNNFTVTNVASVGLSLYSAQQSSAALNTNSPIILPDASQFSTANSFGMRNRLINGAISIDQRNSGASQTITAAAALAYTVDRWYAYSTGANVTGQRVAGAGALQYVYQFTGSASVTAIGFAQRIEAINSYDLNGTTVTLSAFISNSLLSTVTWTAYYANTADTFGTLASPTRTQIATGSWTVTSSLARYTANIVIPTAATTGIEIVFTVGAQTSGTWRIGAVQFEPGTVATPFERRHFSTELYLCQRYLYRMYPSGSNSFLSAGNWANTTNNGFFHGQMPALMFAVPTLTLEVAVGSYSTYNTNAATYTALSALALNSVTTRSFYLLSFTSSASPGAVGIGVYLVNPTGNAGIQLVAEL